jgi:hypothetical protein
VIGPLHGPLAGGTRLTLIGQSLILTSYDKAGVNEDSATVGQNASISSVAVGDYLAKVDRVNR